MSDETIALLLLMIAMLFLGYGFLFLLSEILSSMQGIQQDIRSLLEYLLLHKDS